MEPKQPIRDVSPERKAGYSLGLFISIAGGILFGIGFLTMILNFGNFNNFESRAKGVGVCCFLGIVMLAAGGMIRNVSARGLAGSGMVLDPQKAREDLEPFSREIGGVVNDALSEVDLASKLGTGGSAPTQIIKIKCPQCAALNDEDAKFCKGCGGKM